MKAVVIALHRLFLILPPTPEVEDGPTFSPESGTSVSASLLMLCPLCLRLQENCGSCPGRTRMDTQVW